MKHEPDALAALLVIPYVAFWLLMFYAIPHALRRLARSLRRAVATPIACLVAVCMVVDEKLYALWLELEATDAQAIEAAA